MPANDGQVGEMSDAVAGELRAELARRRISARQMATHTGIPLSTLQRTLNGGRVVDVDDLEQFGRFFNIEPTELLARATRMLRTNEETQE